MVKERGHQCETRSRLTKPWKALLDVAYYKYLGFDRSANRTLGACGFLRFNREGDLLFSCAKDNHPTLWFSSDGKRAGTYVGHNGAVPTCDVSWDSERLITASTDSTAKLWDVMSGQCLFTWKFSPPCKAVAFSLGTKLAAVSTDPFREQKPQIHLVSIADDVRDQTGDVALHFEGFDKRINRLVFTDLNRTLLSAGEDGYVRRWDVETGKELDANKIHGDSVADLQMSVDGTHFVTASADKSAKLVDTQSLEVIKTYPFERPANAAALSPTRDHVLIGGGQDASTVTTTSSKAGGFEARFFHKIYLEEFAQVKGHFGPINSVAFHPSGSGFVTGGEDGYVRLHYFDSEYFATRWLE